MSQIPSDFSVFIGSSIFMTVLVMVNLSRNGYDFYIGKYCDDIGNYLNGTSEIINTEQGNNHYNDISDQFNTNICYLKDI